MSPCRVDTGSGCCCPSILWCKSCRSCGHMRWRPPGRLSTETVLHTTDCYRKPCLQHYVNHLTSCKICRLLFFISCVFCCPNTRTHWISQINPVHLTSTQLRVKVKWLWNYPCSVVIISFIFIILTVNILLFLLWNFSQPFCCFAVDPVLDRYYLTIWLIGSHIKCQYLKVQRLGIGGTLTYGGHYNTKLRWVVFHREALNLIYIYNIYI